MVMSVFGVPGTNVGNNLLHFLFYVLFEFHSSYDKADLSKIEHNRVVHDESTLVTPLRILI